MFATKNLFFCGLLLIANVLYAQREESGDTQRTAKDSTLFQYLAAYDNRQDDPKLNYKIASLYLKDDQYEKALPYALKSQELAPNAQAHYLVANLYTYTKKNAFAIEALRKAIAIEMKPDYIILLNLNRLLLNTKDGVLDERREFTHIHSFEIKQLEAWALDPAHPYYTQTLMDKFNKDWSSLGMDEYFMLYFGQSVAPSYNPYGIGSEDVNALKKLYKDAKYDDAISMGNKLFKEKPLDFDVNWYLALSHYKLKQYEPYEKHMSIYRSLMLSIMSTGDGNTTKTAYIVINVHDEYELLDFLDISSSSQALLHDEGHSFDRLSGIDRETGKEVDVYFNIDMPFGSLSKMLGDIKIDDDKKKKKKGK